MHSANRRICGCATGWVWPTLADCTDINLSTLELQNRRFVKASVSDAVFFIQPQSFKYQVPPAVYDRGMVLYLNQLVLSYEVCATASNCWDVFGMVKGSQKQAYSVDVSLEVDRSGNVIFFDSSCSCAVGTDCKHAVALTLKAAYSSARSTKSPAAQASKPDDDQTLKARLETQAQMQREKERQESLRRVGQWLNLFGEEVSDVKPTAFKPDQNEWMVFLLEPQSRAGLPVLHLSYGYTRRLNNGRWAKLKVPQYLQSYNTPKPDMEIVQLIQALKSTSGGYTHTGNHGMLSGETGRLALQLAADAGKLFHQVEDRVVGIRIRLGAPRTFGWQWNEVTLPGAAESNWALRPQVEGKAEAVSWF
ncbi:MAG: SWIM zinc finger family protein, partial [Rhodoferax sp.]|nr:SWIM zinc finger family protein [Rhodoferax sp.]